MSLDPEAREREYSPSSRIGGDYAPYLQRYRIESARAHRALPVRRDLRYGAAPRALIDFFPAAASRPGLLVYFHGGYWQELSKDESAFLAPAWHAAGFAHAVVGYTLAPEARLPAIVANAGRAALAAGVGRGARLRCQTTSSSPAAPAGGVSRRGVRGRDCPACSRGIVPVSGIYDVAPLIGTSINDALGLDEATAIDAGSADASAPFCPAVVAWGEIETSEFKRQSRAFAARLAADGIACTSLEVPGRNHFDVVLELGDSATSHALRGGAWRCSRRGAGVRLRHGCADARSARRAIRRLEHLAQAIDRVPDVDEARVERREAEAQDVGRAEVADHAARDQRLHDGVAAARRARS